MGGASHILNVSHIDLEIYAGNAKKSKQSKYLGGASHVFNVSHIDLQIYAGNAHACIARRLSRTDEPGPKESK